jgi:hypothetical protein
MSTRMENYNQSVRKLRDQFALEYGQDVNDPNFVEGFHEFEKKAVENRMSEYTQKIIKKYPLKLLQKTFDWATANLSPSEVEGTSFEEVMMQFIAANPNEVSLKDCEIFFDKKSGNLKNLIEDPYESELRSPDTEALQRGEVKEVEASIPHPKRGPEMPSPQKLKGMKSDDIAKLIQASGDAGVSEE